MKIEIFFLTFFVIFFYRILRILQFRHYWLKGQVISNEAKLKFLSVESVDASSSFGESPHFFYITCYYHFTLQKSFSIFEATETVSH